jgi:hypothetical protein
MLDEPAPGESAPDELTLQALLYASGELDAPDAARFELRLGQDQEARDALLQAVQMTSMGQPAVAPDPEYRDRVRQRLRQRKRMLRTHAQGSAFGPAALWCALGAVAAVLLMLVLSHMLVQQGGSTPPTAPSTAPAAERPRSLEERSFQQLERVRTLAAEATRTAEQLVALPPAAPERAALEESLRRQTRALVEQEVEMRALEIQLRNQELERLARELTHARGDLDNRARTRYEALLQKAAKN